MMTGARVKVCGITRRDDALLAADLGASAIGFVFWPRSPRYVEPETAAAIARELPADVAPVGVFVDPTVGDVRRIAAQVGLAAVQLHGDEPATLCDGLPYRVLKAVPVAGEATCAAAERVPAASPCFWTPVTRCARGAPAVPSIGAWRPT